MREGVLFRKRGSVVPNPNPELEPPRPLLMLPLICQHQWAGRLIMGKGGGTQSKESDGELLCSRVSEFLPPSPPLVNTWWKYFLLIWGRYGGQQWGGGGGNVLQGCGWVWGVVGDGWTGCSDTCERLPLSGKTFKRKPGATWSQYITPKAATSYDSACRRVFVAPVL